MPDELDRRLRAADPVDPATLPSASDTNEALSRLSALRARRNRRPAFARPTWVLGTTSVLAAAAIVAVLLFSAAATPTPSYAVTRHKNGTVTVRLASPHAIAALNRRLQLMGVPARITLGDYAAARLNAAACGAKAAASLETFSFDPKAIPVGHLLVLTADQRLHFLYARAVAMKMARARFGRPIVQLLRMDKGVMSRLPAAARARLLQLRFMARGSAVALPKLLMLRMLTIHGRLVARPLALASAQAYARAAVGPRLLLRPTRTVRIFCARNKQVITLKAQH